MALGALSEEPTRARAASALDTCRGARLAPSAGDDAAVARATICLVNLERRRHHLAHVRMNAALSRIALGQSVDMVRGNYFADHSLGGRSPLARIVPALSPAHVTTTGQNIGWGTGADATPEGIVRAWMLSPPHRRIILTPTFREAGVGVAASLPAVLEQGTQGATYTLDLTALAASSPAPRTSTAASHTTTAAATRRPAASDERLSSSSTSIAQEVSPG